MAFFPTDVSKLIKRLAKIEKDEIDFTRKYANENMTEKRMETWLKMMNKGENIRDEMIRHSFFADVYEGVEERCHYTDMHQLGMILMNAYTMDRIEKEVHGEEPDEDLFYAAASLIQNAMTEMEEEEGEEDDDEDWDDDDWDEEEEWEEKEEWEEDEDPAGSAENITEIFADNPQNKTPGKNKMEGHRLKVKISDIVDAFDFMDDNAENYLDLETGEIVYINDMFMDSGEVQELYNQLDEHDCIHLPNQRDLREYDTMEAFVETLKGDQHDRLREAISGRGAFSRFKDGIRRFGIQDQWYAFRDASHRRKAIEWCRENDLDWE